MSDFMPRGSETGKENFTRQWMSEGLKADNTERRSIAMVDKHFVFR